MLLLATQYVPSDGACVVLILFFWGLNKASPMSEARGCAFLLQVIAAMIVIALLGAMLLQVFQWMYPGV